jgi:hypothetical protein
VCKSTPIIRIEASFGSSAVRVNTETVYSGRCEAGVVMTSVSDYATNQELESEPDASLGDVALPVANPSPRRDGPSHLTMTQLTATHRGALCQRSALCQRKVEMSGFLPSRNVRFHGFLFQGW